MSKLDIGKDSLKYIQFIRDKKCTVLGCRTQPSDPDHLKAVGMGRDRKKPMIEHFSCIPLCRKHHTERHIIGNFQFEHKYSLNLWKDLYYYFLEFVTNG